MAMLSPTQGALGLCGADDRPALGHVHLEQFHRVRIAELPGVGRESPDRQLDAPVLELKFQWARLLDEGVPDLSRPDPANGRRQVRGIGEGPVLVAYLVVAQASVVEQVLIIRGKGCGVSTSITWSSGLTTT